MISRRDRSLGDGDRATVRYFTIEDPNGRQLRSIRMDRRWFPAQRCKRDDSQGWECTDLTPVPAPQPRAAAAPNFRITAIRVLSRARTVARAGQLTTCRTRSPASPSATITAPGLVVDAERGLVVVDRNTVPVAVGDVTSRSPARSRFPAASSTFTRCTILPSSPTIRSLGKTPVKTAKLAARDCRRARRSGWSASARTVSCVRADADRRRRAARAAAVAHHALSRQQSRGRHSSSIRRLDYDGVLLDKDGQVLGLWSSFAYENGRELTQDNKGVPIDLVS